MSAKYYLLRHAEADYSGPSKIKTKGWGFDLAPLSKAGRAQVENAISDVKKISPEILITSPTTRTLETTLILIKHFETEYRVEFDLHEWIPGFDFKWRNIKDIERVRKDFEANGGEYMDGEPKNWETLSMIRKRVTSVLNKYSRYSSVLVICHGKMIRAMTGRTGVANCEVIEL